MRRKENSILAINPGTKYIGLAVFEGLDLIYWGIKAFKGKWSKEKMNKINATLLDLINQYGITRIILKKINQSKSSRNLDQIVKATERLATKQKIKTDFYKLEDIKIYLTENERANKIDIESFVTDRFPFLNCHLEKEKKNKHRYFIRMFEAIAAGIFAIIRLSR